VTTAYTATEDVANGNGHKVGPYKLGAIRYRDAGWAGILRMGPGKKFPPPAGYTGHGAPDPDTDQIETWYLEGGDGNLSLRLPPDVMGIDVDQYADKIGGETLAALEARWGELPPTWVSTSRDDGVSGIRLFRIPEGLKWPGVAGKDIEIIQAGHRYAMVWPSVHPEGRKYRWFDPDGDVSHKVPRPDQLPKLPDSWVQHLTGGELDDGTNAMRVDVSYADVSGILTEGEPCQATVKAMAKYDSLLQHSAHHDAMRDTVMAVVRLAHQTHQGTRVAIESLRTRFMSDTAKPGRGAGSEFQRFLLGGVSKVLARPTPDADKRCCGQRVDLPTFDIGELPSYTATDDGNALRLIAEHGARLRRVADMKRWHAWDGNRWALDHDDRATREAARDLARQLPGYDTATKTFKRNSMSATGISGAVRVAETDPRVSIRANELDAHPELLNTPSGVINLRTGEITEHDPRLLLTRITSHGANLEAPHPRWDGFLAETFDDPTLIGYMQRLAGLALLGNVREHILPFLHGVGANGKGVFTLVLQGLLGDADSGGYAVSAPDGFLMAGRDGVHPTEIARLRGARLVVCSEQTSGKRFDESKVKRLTGGDLLTGRFMRGDFFDFTPSHLVWVLSNHLPAVREGGPSFWRRVRLIPFVHVVPDDQQVADLHEQLLADEGPAILGWAVRGATEVLAGGLADPAAVIAATRDYEISEDTLHRSSATNA
jgi:P4 family phage/plasmid primase-like protien